MSDVRATWKWLLVPILVVPTLIALGWMIFADRSMETLGPIRGLRLGTAPSQAREQLLTGAPGSFRGEAMGEDFALLWTPDDPSASELRSARLEFHSAQLVAVRMTLSPSAPEADGPELALTDFSLLTRERTRADVELTWLARSCPTHADEVRRRMNGRSLPATNR